MRPISLLAGIPFAIFVCFPAAETTPLLFFAVILLINKKYYLEALATLASVCAFGKWYLGSAYDIIKFIHTPVLMLGLFLFTFMIGWHKQIDSSEKRIASVSFIGLSFLALFSELKAVSLLKTAAVFIGYQTVLSIARNQKKRLHEYVYIFLAAEFLANLVHGFNLWMPVQGSEYLLSDLYSGVWMHSQTAGVLYGYFLVLLFSLKNKKISFKLFFILCFIPLLYMTRCRTGIFGVVLAVIFLFQNPKVRLSAVILGIILVLISPTTVKQVANKRTQLAYAVGDSVIETMYSTRLDKIKEHMTNFSGRLFFTGRGLGVAVESNSGEDAQWRQKYLEQGTIKILGYKFVTSYPVEYGNMYIGVLSGTGIIGSLLIIIYFAHYFKLLGPTARTLFKYLLVIDWAEAILLSPTGNPAMLFILCLMMIYENCDTSNITAKFSGLEKLKPSS